MIIKLPRTSFNSVIKLAIKFRSDSLVSLDREKGKKTSSSSSSSSGMANLFLIGGVFGPIQRT